MMHVKGEIQETRSQKNDELLVFQWIATSAVSAHHQKDFPKEEKDRDRHNKNEKNIKQ